MLNRIRVLEGIETDGDISKEGLPYESKGRPQLPPYALYPLNLDIQLFPKF